MKLISFLVHPMKTVTVKPPDVELKAYHHFELDETRKIKGILIHSSTKTRTKKTVQWREDERLKTYRYFETDETTVHHTKPLGDIDENHFQLPEWANEDSFAIWKLSL
jgi:hypothetical protein